MATVYAPCTHSLQATQLLLLPAVTGYIQLLQLARRSFCAADMWLLMLRACAANSRTVDYALRLQIAYHLWGAQCNICVSLPLLLLPFAAAARALATYLMDKLEHCLCILGSDPQYCRLLLVLRQLLSAVLSQQPQQDCMPTCSTP
jgi:hypothetical protein